MENMKQNVQGITERKIEDNTNRKLAWFSIFILSGLVKI